MATELTAILFALSREAMFFRRIVRQRRRLPGAPCPAWSGEFGGRPLLLLQTGMGAAAASRALAWLLDAMPRCQVVSAGFCGALAADLPVGTVIVPRAVVRDDGSWWPLPGTGGRLLSVNEPVGDAPARLALGARHDAVAVDMESARLVAACQAAGVPCTCVRAVSDDVRTGLSPALVKALQGERVQVARLALALLGCPKLASEMWRLAWQSRCAARNLAMALQQLLEGAGCPG